MTLKIAALAALLPTLALAQPPASEVAITAEPHQGEIRMITLEFPAAP